MTGKFTMCCKLKFWESESWLDSSEIYEVGSGNWEGYHTGSVLRFPDCQSQPYLHPHHIHHIHP